MNKAHLQGDIGLKFITKEEFESIKGEIQKHNGEFVLALGETTGHAHRLKVKEPEQMVVIKDALGNLYIQLLEPGTLTHEEHGTHVIKPSYRKLEHEREHDYFSLETRNVIG